MQTLTDKTIRASFVNASRRELTEAPIPDLTTVGWDRLDYLGWTDPQRPAVSYVALEVDGDVSTVILRLAGGQTRRKAMCAWCEDISATHNVAMFSAKRAGAAGRKGDTVGTLICADFGCSRNVRRAPSLSEIGATPTPEELEFWQAIRIEHLKTNFGRLLQAVTR